MGATKTKTGRLEIRVPDDFVTAIRECLGDHLDTSTWVRQLMHDRLAELAHVNPKGPAARALKALRGGK